MRHLVDRKGFGLSVTHRKAMFNNMAASLITHERIKTTAPRAKELRRLVDRLITWGKKGDLHSIRLARTYIQDKDVLKKLSTELKERFSKRKGGYTRIFKTTYRRGDAAPMALIELIPDEKAKAKKAEDKAKKKEAKAESKKEAAAKEEKAPEKK